LISINYLRSFGSFGVLNLACFQASVLISNNYCRIWPVLGSWIWHILKASVLIPNTYCMKKIPFFFRLTWREHNCTPKIGLLKPKRLHAYIHGYTSVIHTN
jgi:hypothetical protein